MDATPRVLAEDLRRCVEEMARPRNARKMGYCPENVDESVAYGSHDAVFNFNVGQKLFKVTVADVTPDEDE